MCRTERMGTQVDLELSSNHSCCCVCESAAPGKVSAVQWWGLAVNE